MKEQYIKAVVDLLQSSTDVARAEKVLHSLKNVLHERGHERLLSGILKGVAKKMERTPTDTPVIVLVNSTDTEFKKYESVILSSVLKPDLSQAVVKEDPHLIGGFKLSIGSTMIDNSYKTKLLTLYRNITT